ncbi:GNAT family N-acetyltransferase [Infirmifilum sp. SLHALR2]|nr:MAG: hypothetical protein B7L53_06765 [Thermofilum sp. NZ13]
MLLGFESFEEFVEWYRELGKLRVFWAKNAASISLVGLSVEAAVVSVKWLVRRRVVDASLVVCSSPAPTDLPALLSRVGGSAVILVVPKGTPFDASLVDAKSVLYFWGPNAEVLEPNREVEVRVYREWSSEDMAAFERVQKQSWGFFVPPRPGDHRVVAGFLGGEPVALAYLNARNFNIDYGVHVARRYWRRRVGTRILAELLSLARELGAKRVSVVRVFRSARGTTSDLRAASFYEANRPSLSLEVYRLKTRQSGAQG